LSKKKHKLKEKEKENKTFKERLRDSFHEPLDKANLRKVIIIGILGAIITGFLGGFFDYMLFVAGSAFFIGVLITGFITAGLVAVFKNGNYIIYPFITLAFVLLGMFVLQLTQYFFIYVIADVWNVGFLFIYTFFFPWISLVRSFQVIGESTFTSYFWTGILNLVIYSAVFAISFIGVYRTGRNEKKNK